MDNKIFNKYFVVLSFITLLSPPIGILLFWILKTGSLVFRLLITIIPVIFLKKLLVIYIILYGKVIFPETSDVVRHYSFGDGSTLISKSDYIKISPVILSHIKIMKTGEVRKVGVHQREDFRLTYALNPFTIYKSKDKIIISQWMKFDKTGKLKTMIGPFSISDDIVHTFDCTPYLFYYEFKLNELNVNKKDPPNMIEQYFINDTEKKGWSMGRNYKKLNLSDSICRKF